MDKSKEAETLLRHPLIVEFFDTYKKALFERWLNTPDAEERDEIYQLQVAADAFRLHLQQYVLTGKLEMMGGDNAGTDEN